ncbi:MAG TPA: hypothetical protein VF101_12115 [Gaiellaceae bacterium]
MNTRKLLMRLFGSAAIAAVVAAGALAIRTTPASADTTVSGCTLASSAGGWFCVNVVTGGKDYTYHRQWVVSINMRATSLCQNRWEAWTQNWYVSQYVGCQYWSPTFYINRWVGSGNYVCGRGWKWNDIFGWGYATACIKISV